MEIQKTEIYETKNLAVRHESNGSWEFIFRQAVMYTSNGGIVLQPDQFEELAEILRSIG